jgi:hypothetical protein
MIEARHSLPEHAMDSFWSYGPSFQNGTSVSYSWTRQTESMTKLLNYDFEWVLPGHGSLHHDTTAKMRYHLQSCIAWMKTRG